MFITSHRYRRITPEPRRARLGRFLRSDIFYKNAHSEDEEMCQRIRNKYSFSVSWLLHLMPFIFWIRRYSWKYHLLRDFLGGLTVSVILIPQGLAYAQLADCPPVVGLYMGVFPVVIFAFLTTSKHIAYGPMALICLMSDAVITEVQNTKENSNLSRVEIGTVVSFTVSLWLLIGFILRLGCMSNLMSKTFISSFNTGVSVHVFSSQLKEFFGIPLQKHYEIFGIVYQYKELVLRISETNLVSLGIALSSFAIIETIGFFNKPIKFRKLEFTFPVEFVLMVIGGLVSYFANLNANYNVRIVGFVPMGFPSPSVPPLALIPEVAKGSFIVAIVAYFLTVSVALYFSSLKKYKIDSTQEFLSQGAANLVGSFFHCLPCSASISRSTVGTRAGSESQISSLVTVVILVSVLFLIARILTPIPRALLAAIIISSVIAVFRNSAKDLALLWSVSYTEMAMWTATWLVVVFVGIDSGLAFGLFLSFVTAIVHAAEPVMYLMGRVSANGGYMYTRLGEGIGSELPGIKIVQIDGPVSFATRDSIQRKVQELVAVNPKNVSREIEERSRYKDWIDNDLMTVEFKQENRDPRGHSVAKQIRSRLHYIVLDITLSRVVDYSGTQCLCAVAQAFAEVGVVVVVVARDGRASPLRDVDSTVRQLEAALAAPPPSPLPPPTSPPSAPPADSPTNN